MNATPSAPVPDVPERIARIIYVLCQTVTMRLRVRALTNEQVTYIVGRLLGIRRRFQGLVARIRAGKPPTRRARKPRPNPARPEDAFPPGFRPPPPGWRRWAPRAEKPVPLWRSLRQHVFAWLCPLAPAVPEFRESAAACGEQLRHLLVDPEMRTLLMSCRSLGDSLRSVCWMLGVEKSLLYPEPIGPAPVAAMPDQHDVTVADMPPASTLAKAMPSSRESPAAQIPDDFFALG